MFACQYQTNVLPMTIKETALPASRDMTLRKVPVSSLTSTMPSPPIQDAEHGIGTTKSAFPALKDGFSMLTRSVSQCLTTVPLMTIKETALPASRDMTLRKVPVSSLTSTMLRPLTLVVPLGTGIIKSAFPAQRDGSSMLTKSASPSTTTAMLTMPMVPVLPATQDTQ